MQKVAASVLALGALQGCGSDSAPKTTQVRGTGSEIQDNVQWAMNNQEPIKEKVLAKAREVINGLQANKMITKVMQTFRKADLNKEQLQHASDQLHKAIKEVHYEVVNNSQSMEGQVESFKAQAMELLNKAGKQDFAKKEIEDQWNLFTKGLDKESLHKSAEDLVKDINLLDKGAQQTAINTFDSVMAQFFNAVGKQPVSNKYISELSKNVTSGAHYLSNQLEQQTVHTVAEKVRATEASLYNDFNYEKVSKTVVDTINSGISEKNVKLQFEKAKRDLNKAMGQK